MDEAAQRFGSTEQSFIVMPHPEAVADALRIVGEDAYVSRSQPNILIAVLDDRMRFQLERMGAALYRSQQYETTPAPIDEMFAPLAYHPKNLNDVLDHIHAREAWRSGRGEGVHIAIVDTGICDTMAEFPQWKQAPAHFNWSYSGNAWTDAVGHGSMAAAVAAATTSNRGRYDGVAPDAVLISCKTQFYDTELYQIYDHLIQLVENGSIRKLIINNSYGWQRCQPTNVQRSDPFPSIIIAAVSKGITCVFSAGNNHVRVCGNVAGQCAPNTIWAVNSLDEVITVGTVDDNNRMDQPCQNPAGYCHRDSSRGPGELSAELTKPDCVAPTYGEVVWGCGYRIMEWWGTSGAAPQVAGLAALIAQRAPQITPAEIADVIRAGCKKIPLGAECAGAGVINCFTAVSHPRVLKLSKSGTDLP